MPDHTRSARAIASAVLARMLADSGPAWMVLDTALSGTPHVLVTAGSGPGASDVVSFYFTADVPEADAIVATGDPLQDHAIEAAGARRSRLPGHAHPLSDPAHHQERIAPADPR